MSIAYAIARGTITTLVVNTVGSILRRPPKLTFDHSGSQTRKLRHVANFLLLLLACSVVSPTIAVADVPEVRRVLVLNDFDEIASPGIALLDQGIFAALNHSRYQIEWYSESLAANLFTDEISQRGIRNGYILKYKDRKPDVIIAVGPASLQFMVQSHEKFFPGVPIVFCGSSEDMLEKLKPDSSFTGVWGVVQPEETLTAALRLQPSTKYVVVVGGVGTYDRRLEGIVKKSLRNYESSLKFIYLTDLDMPTLLRQLGQLPSNTIVLYTSIFQDATGRHFIDANQSSPVVIDASNAPVFVLFDVNFGTGAVGGDTISFASDGNVAGDMALRILDGEQPQGIPVVKNADVWTFDWRSLHRWGFKERDLPPNSIVLDRQPTLWESYKRYIIAGFSLIVLETVLIVALLWQRARRTKAESELSESATLLQSREELLKTFVKNVPTAVAMLDREMRYLQVSDRWCTDYLSGRERVVGRSHYEIFPDMPERWKEVHRRGLQGETLREDEDRWDGKDGPHWARWEVRPWNTPEGTVGGILILAEDITRRKQMEEALSEMSRKLIQAQEQERTRIGRELHDDINQRIAMLAVELDQLQNDPSDVQNRLQELRKQTAELSNDVQALSHELHSSKLEYLGIVSGIKSWCREFGERQKLEIDFKSDVSIAVPFDVGICLFRVLQEALHNSLKHSGVRRIEVQLHEESGEIHFTIRDLGRGFDIETARQGRGLGLMSMQERVRLVNGAITIESKPMGGTTIHVRVPLGQSRVPSEKPYSKRAIAGADS